MIKYLYQVQFLSEILLLLLIYKRSIMLEYLKEEFKQMVDEDGDVAGYTISNYGRVWCERTQSMVSQVLTGKPQYYYVNYQRKGQKRKLRRVHNLLARSWLPNPDNLLFVDHIDRNKYNNSLDNLRWASREDNARNTKSTIYVDYKGERRLFIDLVYILSKALNVESSAFIAYFSRRLKVGESFEDILEKYKRFLETGVIEKEYIPDIIEHGYWKIDLRKYCERYGVEYSNAKQKQKEGRSVEEILYNLYMVNRDSVIQLESKNGVNICYLSPTSFMKHYGITKLCYDSLDLTQPLEDVESNITFWQNTSKIEVDGLLLSIEEFEKKYDTTWGRVRTLMNRHNLTINEALSLNKRRIARYLINGISKLRKDWITHFGVEEKTIRYCMEDKRFSFKDALSYCGIDVSVLDIKGL